MSWMTGNKTKGLILGLTSASTQIWASPLLLLRSRYFRTELSARMMHLHLCSARHNTAPFSPSVCSHLGPDCTSKSLWLAPKHLKSPLQLPVPTTCTWVALKNEYHGRSFKASCWPQGLWAEQGALVPRILKPHTEMMVSSKQRRFQRQGRSYCVAPRWLGGTCSTEPSPLSALLLPIPIYLGQMRGTPV